MTKRASKAAATSAVKKTRARPDRGGDTAATHGVKRSPHWGRVRAAYIKKNPLCAACGPELDTRDHNEVHHIIPFHFCVLLGRPDLELDARNLITLCEHDDYDHHLLIGHLNHFQSSNPDVRTDAQTRYYGWTQDRITIDSDYQKRAKNRPKEWSAMTDADKAALRKLMDDMFPPLPPDSTPPAPAKTRHK